MVLNFLLSLEDPDHPLLGPTLWGLKSVVMCRSIDGKVQIIKSFLFLLSFLQLISEYTEFYYLRENLSLALKNLSISILAHISAVKIGTFIYWQKDWMSVMDYVSSVEKRQLNQQDQVTNEIIKKYTKYCRSVTYCYWALVAISTVTYTFTPLVFYYFSLHINKSINTEVPYPEIISCWVPFDKTEGFGYWTVTVVSIFLACYVSTTFAIYDSNSVVLMTFFAGQLEIMKTNCEKLFGNGEETISYQESVRRIQIIHEDHVLLVKYSKVLKCLLSPVMFQYLIICSVMMCSSAVHLTTEGVSVVEKLWIAEYLLAQIFQLFLFCWHSQKVLNMSINVAEGVYSSAWWSQDVRVRRSVTLLAGQLNKNIIFSAGPFTNLSINTFVTIIKGAYSYYTLLSNKR